MGFGFGFRPGANGDEKDAGGFGVVECFVETFAIEGDAIYRDFGGGRGFEDKVGAFAGVDPGAAVLAVPHADGLGEFAGAAGDDVVARVAEEADVLGGF